MINFIRLTTLTFLTLLALTTGCSQSPSSQSTTTSSQKSTTASGQSSTAKIALASHLKQLNTKFYGAYWCPYCHKQKDLFGEQAMKQVNYIECDEKGKNPHPDLCQKAQVSSLPTWEIKGQKYPGMLSLEELADASDYKGDRNFGK
jgi:thiol-disulfide isomerase/thioredoxin